MHGKCLNFFLKENFENDKSVIKERNLSYASYHGLERYDGNNQEGNNSSLDRNFILSGSSPSTQIALGG